MTDRKANDRLHAVLEHFAIEAPSIRAIHDRRDRQQRTRTSAVALFAAAIVAMGAGFLLLGMTDGSPSDPTALPSPSALSTDGLDETEIVAAISALRSVIVGHPLNVIDEGSETIRLAPPISIFDYLPEAPMRLASTVVRGQIVSVEPGRSFTWTQVGEEDVRHVAPFDEPGALVRSVHVHVRVDAESPEGSRVGTIVAVAIFVPPASTLRQIESELTALGGVVLFLNQAIPILDYADDLHGVAADGDLFGVVDDTGTIEFPLADESLLPDEPIRLADLELS